MNILRILTMLIFLLSVSIFIVVSGRLTGREEIVFPSIETLRSGEKRLSFRALNEDIELKLESAGNVFGEGFFVESIHDGRSTIPELNLHDIKQNLYRDKRTGASLHIEEKEHTLIRGIINHKLRIEPHESEARIRGGVRSHRIIEYIEEDGFHENDAVKPGANFHANINKSADDLRSGEPIYVEICIVTDTAFTKLFSNDYAIVLYVAILINGAQCRYDNLKNIRVILVFSGLKIVRYARDEPYIQNNLVEGHLLKGFDALNDFGTYMGRAGYTCDVIKLLTKLDLVDEVDGKLASGLLGLAYIGTVCDTSSEPHFSYKVGISEDDAHCFAGVRTVAHELAHSLGCGHDGDLPLSYIEGHPGSKNCPWDDGYIMSYVQESLNRYYFSSCCEDCIRYSAMIFDCLRNNNTGYNLGVSSEIPGVQMENTLGYSASKYENEKVAYYDHRCRNLKRGDFFLLSFKYPDGTCSYACRTEVNEENQYYYWIMDCLDGDMCDTGKRCFHGQCI